MQGDQRKGLSAAPSSGCDALGRCLGTAWQHCPQGQRAPRAHRALSGSRRGEWRARERALQALPCRQAAEAQPATVHQRLRPRCCLPMQQRPCRPGQASRGVRARQVGAARGARADDGLRIQRQWRRRGPQLLRRLRGVAGADGEADGQAAHTRFATLLLSAARRRKCRVRPQGAAQEAAAPEAPEELTPLIEALERARHRANAATALREALESEARGRARALAPCRRQACSRSALAPPPAAERRPARPAARGSPARLTRRAARAGARGGAAGDPGARRGRGRAAQAGGRGGAGRGRGGRAAQGGRRARGRGGAQRRPGQRGRARGGGHAGRVAHRRAPTARAHPRSARLGRCASRCG